MVEATVAVVNRETLLSLLGARDQHLRRIRQELQVAICARDNEILLQGEADAVSRATEVIERLKVLANRQGALGSEEVSRVLGSVTGNGVQLDDAPVLELDAGRTIRPKTSGQFRYVRAIEEHDITLCIGPAGTGKTFLAVAMAVASLKQHRTRKIVLVRPAVEAGESLGFLPGDMAAKINPYLRPLLDALRSMLDFEQMKRYTEQDVIEVIPLAYMRGRTLDDAFIILDEAQNTTVSQMKMFLTRMGNGSKIVVSGDATQVDLPIHAKNGLLDAVDRLRGIKGFSVVTLTDRDVVRHRLVREIIRRYEAPLSKGRRGIEREHGDNRR